MRFLLPLLGLVAIAAGGAEIQQDRLPVVILVHGRGHLEDDSAALRRGWKRDLDSALASVGLPRLADSDVRLAWYADVLDPAFDSGCEITRSSDDSLGFDSFARDFLGSLASALPRTESREVRSFLGDLLYAADGSRRCAAERRVGEAIERAVAEKRPVIVVAYSLGSLVAYGYLNSRAVTPGESTDIRFVTIGSPLGNREIRELLGQGTESLRLPRAARGWENVYDPNDAFAAPLDLAVPGVRDRTVEGAAQGDRHHIGRYLRDRSTGVAIGRALCATAPRQPLDACARL